MALKTTAFFRRILLRPDPEIIRLSWVKISLRWPGIATTSGRRQKTGCGVDNLKCKLATCASFLLEEGNGSDAFFSRSIKP